MRNKVLSVFLIIVMLAGIMIALTGCGNKSSEINDERKQNSVEENNESLSKVQNSDMQLSNLTENEKLQVGNFTLEYGKYEGIVNNGGYTLTEICKIEKDKITIGAEEFEYTIKENQIVAKNADSIRLKVIGNNSFTDAQGVYKFTYVDKDNNQTSNNISHILKLDARYIYKDDNIVIQIELYKDNTMYYSYVPKKERTSEYYNGTFSIDGNKLTMNLTADGENRGTKVIQNGNTISCTLISDTEFKDEQGRIIKYSIDYPKGLRPDQRI